MTDRNQTAASQHRRHQHSSNNSNQSWLYVQSAASYIVGQRRWFFHVPYARITLSERGRQCLLATTQADRFYVYHGSVVKPVAAAAAAAAATKQGTRGKACDKVMPKGRPVLLRLPPELPPTFRVTYSCLPPASTQGELRICHESALFIAPAGHEPRQPHPRHQLLHSCWRLLRLGPRLGQHVAQQACDALCQGGAA